MSENTFPAGTTVRHGTESGWSMHQQLGQLGACNACYEAKSRADKRRKDADSTLVLRGRLNAKAQQRALKQLKDNHPDEYRSLYVAIRTEIFTAANMPERRRR